MDEPLSEIQAPLPVPLDPLGREATARTSGPACSHVSETVPGRLDDSRPGRVDQPQDLPDLSDAAAPPTIKLYLLYRNRLFKEVMEHRFRGDRRLALVGATTSANEAIRRANNGSRVDVVLIETAVERELAVWVTRSLYGVQARTKVMPVGLRRTSEIVEFLRAGAAGYLDNEASYSELVSTFESLERGEPPCSFRVAGRVCSAISSLSRNLPKGPLRPAPDGMTLTPREQEVAHFIARGLTNKDIARELRVSPATIKNHVHNVLRKLKAQGRDEIVLGARQDAISVTA